MTRVALASLDYETNSFCPGIATLDDFAFAEGPELFEIGQGLDEIAGARDAALRHGIVLVPTTAAGGVSGPVVEGATYARLRSRFLDGLAAVRDSVEGVYLRLHGAMATDDEEDVEGDLLHATRALFGPDVPIAVSCDLHCHFTQRMSTATPLVVGYHTCPHVDLQETGARAIELLAASLSGRAHPVLRYRKIRMTASSEGHDTSTGPVREVMDRLHEMIDDPDVLDASVFLVQPWLDVAELGWATVVVADRRASLAQDLADELAAMLWDRRDAVLFRKTSLDDALARVRSSPPSARPFVLADGADSCSAGAAGDGVVLLDRLLREPIDGGCLLVVTDAAGAIACGQAGIGSRLTLDLGGSITPEHFRPTRITGTVTTLCDGRYRSSYPPGEADVGPTAVLSTDEGVHAIITTRRANQLDYELFLRVGLDPRRHKIVQVKSAGGYRAFFEPLAFECIDIATPGPADSRLPLLPFRRPVRPLHPFDAVVAEPFVAVTERASADPRGDGP